MQANGGVAEQVTRLQKELLNKERENKNLAPELKRKRGRLSCNRGFTVASKKGPSDFGGPRGRMIPASDRQIAITFIGEAVQAGARERLACLELSLTQRTLQRWRSEEHRSKINALRSTPPNPSSERPLIN